MEEEDVDLVRFPGPGGQGAEFAFPPCEPVSAFSEVLFQQPCNGPRRPFPAAVRGRPLGGIATVSEARDIKGMLPAVGSVPQM